LAFAIEEDWLRQWQMPNIKWKMENEKRTYFQYPGLVALSRRQEPSPLRRG
jgi:hypothetical protein